jgi:hypothetical protein
LTCGNADCGNGRWLRSLRDQAQLLSVAARRPRQRYQFAAGAFPLVIGWLWSDPARRGQPPACRADERPIMCALVGRVTAVRRLIGCLSAASRIRRNRSSADSRDCHVAA